MTSGTFVAGGPFDTCRSTDVPFGSEVPPAGFWWTTWFWGALLSTNVGFGLKPALRRAVIACGRVWPTTLGTVPCAGPVMTLTRTLEPFGTDSPADGDVAVTWPLVLPGTKCSTGFSPASVNVCCACDHCWPLTSGTFTFGGPVETQIETVPPFSTCEPAPGSCLKTTPLSYRSLGPRFTSGTRCAALICRTACACFSPW